MTEPVAPPQLPQSLPGLPGLLGISIQYEDPAQRPDIVGTLLIGEHHLNPAGTVHAATVAALADTACGYGCLAALPDGRSGFTTLELKSNYLGTARAGQELRTEARPIHLGATTQVWDATVTVARGDTTKPVAAFRCTQMLLSPR